MGFHVETDKTLRNREASSLLSHKYHITLATSSNNIQQQMNDSSHEVFFLFFSVMFFFAFLLSVEKSCHHLNHQRKVSLLDRLLHSNVPGSPLIRRSLDLNSRILTPATISLHCGVVDQSVQETSGRNVLLPFHSMLPLLKHSLPKALSLLFF